MPELTPAWQQLIDIFLEKNQQLNLSAIRNPDGVRQKHVLDSLELGKIFPFSDGATCLDLGTGGGFPLLPLAMTYPQVKFTGLDARKKKVNAVNEMIDTLGLKNVRTVRWRAEDHTGRYDIVTARAIAYADQLFSRALPLLKKGGALCVYKQRTQKEDNLILTLMRYHHLTPIAVHHYHLGEESEQPRVLYVLQKW